MPFQTHNPRSSGQWTEERLEMLLKLNTEDVLSRAEIAEELNAETGSSFSRNAVIAKLAWLGVPAKPIRVKIKQTIWTDERIEIVMQLHSENKLSAGQIARELEQRTGGTFSRNAILGKLHRLGAPKKDRPVKIARPTKPRIFRFRAMPKPLPPPVALQDSLRILFDDLGPNHCRYSTSPDGVPMEFCGHPIHERSFCAAHYSICYYTPRAPRPDYAARLRILNARKHRANILKPECEAA